MDDLIDVKGFENYSISRSGLIYNKSTKRFLKGGIDRHDGYIRFNFWKNKKLHKKRIHRLLAENFIPNPKNFPLVRHLNDLKTDNRIENLAWGSKSDNEKDKYKNCTVLIRKNRKFTEIQIKEIYFSQLPTAKLAEIFQVTTRTIRQIKTGHIYKDIVRKLKCHL